MFKMLLIAAVVFLVGCSGEKKSVEVSELDKGVVVQHEGEVTPKSKLSKCALDACMSYYKTLFKSSVSTDIKDISGKYCSIGSYEYDRIYKEFGWIHYVTIEVVMKEEPSPGNEQYRLSGHTFHINFGVGNRSGFEIIKGPSPISLDQKMVSDVNAFVGVEDVDLVCFKDAAKEITLPDHLVKE